MNRFGFVCLVTVALSLSPPPCRAANPVSVSYTWGGGSLEQLAAKEIRRYIYLRTGKLPELFISGRDVSRGDLIVLVGKDSPPGFPGRRNAALRDRIAGLGSQEYLLKTFERGRHRTLYVVGGDAVGMLYGAYRLAEHLGVRFYLHGDVLPDEPIAWHFPELDETGKPLFTLRGLNPWGSHPFGFDLWNTDDYKAHISQMAKMRMNFIGMHCYPEGHPYAEPTVWVGVEGDFDEQGRVRSSYPSSYYNALFRPAWGGLRPGPTSGYHLGAAMLFDRDDWGPAVMREHTPRPVSPEACNEVFNRTGTQFREAFTFARRLGVKTCLGTEAPLTIPANVRKRLLDQGKDPKDAATVQQIYEGIFRRITKTHPLDYYWLWTPENWTWRGNTVEQMQSTLDDIMIARRALQNVGSPFRLATSGWVLGPADDRAAFGRVLPEDIALSAISRQLGEDPVDSAFARITRPGKWAIPWMEGDNGGLAVPQLWIVWPGTSRPFGGPGIGSALATGSGPCGIFVLEPGSTALWEHSVRPWKR